VSQKQAAAQQIYEINKRYAHLNTGQEDAAPKAPSAPSVRVKTQADVDRLPKGTTFVGPDGKTYRKD
jgi:hypothetical protein